ncbi:hypothetical protein [Allocoleopsis sp.]|uniref:hypothetical protein n=1 Tax=Allocoleopsis sp. TaxID=3088169 RepID=UPI002FCFFE40
MRNAEQYPFVSGDTALGEASFRPYLPFTLVHQQGSVTVSGLLDTGASVNVLLHDRNYPVLSGRRHYSPLAGCWNRHVCHPGVPEWRTQRRVRISARHLEPGTPIKAENSPDSKQQ